MIEAALILGAYLVGAIPFGVLIARAKGVDLFKVGSGNVGATNVSRALGTGPALLVFALDILKGVVPAVVAGQVLKSPEWSLGAGLIAVLGHCFSPFLKFKGGKGVATGLGALLGSTPLVALSAFGVFILGMLATRWVSLSSLLAAVAVVTFGLIFGDPPLMIGAYVALLLFLVFKHRGNIQRLMNGTEPKFSFKKQEPPPAEDSTQENRGEDKSDMSYRSQKVIAAKGGPRA